MGSDVFAEGVRFGPRAAMREWSCSVAVVGPCRKSPTSVDVSMLQKIVRPRGQASGRCQAAPSPGNRTTSSKEVRARQKQLRGVTTKDKDVLMGTRCSDSSIIESERLETTSL